MMRSSSKQMVARNKSGWSEWSTARTEVQIAATAMPESAEGAATVAKARRDIELGLSGRMAVAICDPPYTFAEAVRKEGSGTLVVRATKVSDRESFVNLRSSRRHKRNYLLQRSICQRSQCYSRSCCWWAAQEPVSR